MENNRCDRCSKELDFTPPPGWKGPIIVRSHCDDCGIFNFMLVHGDERRRVGKAHVQSPQLKLF